MDPQELLELDSLIVQSCEAALAAAPDKMLYLAEVCSFESWLQMEISYAASRARMGDPTAPHWVKPEWRDVDLPIFRGGPFLERNTQPRAEAECKVFFNDRRSIAYRAGKTRKDFVRLSKPAGRPGYMIVVAVRILYRNGTARWPYQNTISMSDMETELGSIASSFRAIPLARLKALPTSTRSVSDLVLEREAWMHVYRVGTGSASQHDLQNHESLHSE